MKTIFDLFYRKGYECTFCGSFKTSESQMREHIRQYHREQARKEAAILAGAKAE